MLLKTKKFSESIENAATMTVCALMALISFFIMLVSFLQTTGMEIISEEEIRHSCLYDIRAGSETVIYYSDSFILNIIVLALSFFICFAVLPRITKMKAKTLTALLMCWTLILGIVWVLSSMSAPTHDSAEVMNAAAEFAKNDYSALEEQYFKYYSFQLGYVFFNEILIRIANIFVQTGNSLFLEILNVVFLSLTYAAVMLINGKITNDARVHRMTAFLLALCIQPIIFTSFLYGIIPGLTFAVWALYFELLFIENNKKGYAALSVVFIALAIMLKTNYIIVLIAMLLIALVKMISRQQLLKALCYCIITVIIGLSINPAVKLMYEKRSDIQLGASIPYISWIAMGLSEAYPAPGWFDNSYTIENFEKNDYNADKAGEASMRYILNRTGYLLSHPQYCNDFFYKKIVSQWNETSYQSIWNSQVREQYADKGNIASWVCGSGEYMVKRYMDFFAQLIFAAVFFGTLTCMKKKNFIAVTPLIIILGGFLYHLISEAKSQYSLPYFILLTGFAAYGICSAYDCFIQHFKLSGRMKRILLPDSDNKNKSLK